MLPPLLNLLIDISLKLTHLNILNYTIISRSSTPNVFKILFGNYFRLRLL